MYQYISFLDKSKNINLSSVSFLKYVKHVSVCYVCFVDWLILSLHSHTLFSLLYYLFLSTRYLFLSMKLCHYLVPLVHGFKCWCNSDVTIALLCLPSLLQFNGILDWFTCSIRLYTAAQASFCFSFSIGSSTWKSFCWQSVAWKCRLFKI